MRLVDLEMTQERYADAKRVFWITHNGSSHHPSTFPGRLAEEYPNAVAVPLPVHACWLDQIELHHSILQRKALTPRDVCTAEEMDRRVLDFEAFYNQTAQPFAWTYTRKQTEDRMRHLTMAVAA